MNSPLLAKALEMLKSATWLHRLNQNSSILVNLGFSLPTGSIDEKGRTPKDANVDTQLPYTMQLGSGTYDIKPSIVYFRSCGRLDLWCQFKHDSPYRQK